MRYPASLPEGGTIGFVAPSFGCAIEPYKTGFQSALKHFHEMGYQTKLGPNCYAGEGVGISNTPELCGKELNEMYADPETDILISCGGGELMCEVVPYIDWNLIRESRPKWYIGYSDNTNFTFLSTILADTAAIYGPCAPTFGMEPPADSVKDALSVLRGGLKAHNYPKWEKESLKDEEHPTVPYNMTEEYRQRVFVPGPVFNKEMEKPVTESDSGKVTDKPVPESGFGKAKDEYMSDKLSDENITCRSIRQGIVRETNSTSFEGRLIGGCVDILVTLLGTRFDKTQEFLERYKEDGFIWFLESCDLTPLDMRRAFFQMKEAGWFRYVKGFLIGRPLHFDEDMMGVDRYEAVLAVIGELGVPILMDLDIGHLPPQMPLISGAYAKVEAADNRLTVEFQLK
ncbi:MAG: LD-carboxypeptidase [Eubacterium sp.]|nr:LD-carboxypeptidase [Eubacterium sp.]